jgi:hypothetical protein
VNVGQRVSIQIRTRRPAPGGRPGQQPRGTRKGPFARPDDDDAAPAVPSLVFVDCGTKLIQESDDSGLQGDADPLPAGVMCYVERGPECFVPDVEDDFYVDRLRQGYQQDCFNTDSVDLPPFSAPGEYRRASRGLPLFEGLEYAGDLKVVIGRSYPVRKSPIFKKGRTAQQRLASEQAKPSPDAGKVAALTAEVAESDFPTGSNLCRADIVANKWFTHSEEDDRDVLRDAGILQPTDVPPGQYALRVTDAAHFEEFNIGDTAAFKVVYKLNPSQMDFASFDDSEEADPADTRMSVEQSGKLTTVYLMPQLWKFSISYRQRLKDVWQNGDTSELVTVDWSRDFTDVGWTPAFSAPMPLSGYETPVNALTGSNFPSHPQYLHSFSRQAYDPQTTDPVERLRFMTQLARRHLHFLSTSPHVLPTTPSTPQPDAEEHPALYTYVRTELWAQDHGRATVTQEGTPARALVGAVALDPSNVRRQFFVFRRSARVLETPVTIYDGDYDDPGYYSDVSGSGSPNVLRITSFDWPGDAYLPPTFAWQDGGLCAGDSEWPWLPMPRWVDTP